MKKKFHKKQVLIYQFKAANYLQYVVTISIKRCLGQLHCEHTVGATGFMIQLSVGYPPFLLSWTNIITQIRNTNRTIKCQ